MSVYNFKKIQAVPTSTDFIDIVLSKTQRKTPTVVHKHYQISRIRLFYTRKVKFTQETFDEKLGQILTDFPKLDEIHPFYADLINVLYDRDHYKLALGQVNTCKNLIDNVGRDYVRLLKFGDSLYRCKQLKTAALGRMATIMKRQKETLAYLEQVRQHLGRLPSIDPSSRTLLVCGYPNVGKSSFVNKLSNANVEVQPYAFTTKSLFVGHMDYKYLRWQVIDTPGILDHPLEDRNTIEMLSITALAHLRACVMYFMDLTEQCGYSIADQVKLFNNIKPLFANKPLILVINKIDSRNMDALHPEERAMIEEILRDNVDLCQISCYNETGVMDARNFACDKLLTARVESKMRGTKMTNIINKLHVATPVERDEKPRPAFIPEGVLAKKSQMVLDASAVDFKLEKDIEKENGGAGVYNIDLSKKYLLENDEWKRDIIPEIMNGHNVGDFIDPDIEAKLEALEREEEEWEKSGKYNDNLEQLDEDGLKTYALAKEIVKKKNLIIQAHRASKGHPVRPLFQRAKERNIGQLSAKMISLGVEASALEENARGRVGKKRERSPDAEDIVRDETVRSKSAAARSMSRSRLDRSTMGLRNVKQKREADVMRRKAQRGPNLDSKKGEADRVVLTARPKHLFSGKRGIGSNDRR